MAQVTVSVRFKLPEQPETPNILALSRQIRDRITGVVGVTVTLSQPPVSGSELVFLNGALVDPSSYTISGVTLTLGGAAIVTDVLVVRYLFRSNH